MTGVASFIARAAGLVPIVWALALSGCDGRRPVETRPPATPAETGGAGGSSDGVGSPSGLPTGEVVLRPAGGPETRVRVEFATDPEDQQRGLMFRRTLDPDAGMLFVFPLPERHHTFWMRNTLIPLDMIFINDGLQVVGVVERAEPQTDTSREVSGLSRYVLEVNGGFAAEHGIGPGTRVEIVGPER